MAKFCRICGNELSEKQPFLWNGEPVCASCDEGIRRKTEHGTTLPPGRLPFNRGAFALPWLWLSFHGRIRLGIVVFVVMGLIQLPTLPGILAPQVAPLFWIANVGIMFYFGFAGNKIAWSYWDCTSMEDLKKRESNWNVFGVVICALFTFLLLGLNW
jgi:hypothetical protein